MPPLLTNAFTPANNGQDNEVQTTPTSTILGSRDDNAVRNNPFRRNHATVSAEPVEEGRAPFPVRPGYTPDTGGALAAITAIAEQEELEPWVNKFLQEELAKFEGLTGVSNIAEHTITMRDDNDANCYATTV